jgi:hypothetical protein
MFVLIMFNFIMCVLSCSQLTTGFRYPVSGFGCADYVNLRHVTLLTILTICLVTCPNAEGVL